MPAFRCRLGLHRWSIKPATLRPGTMIHRCPLCGLIRVRHGKRDPQA
ncbi:MULTISPECIES: hypothetical protein [Sphingomonas]|uniref:RNHCP domain-containing protein n=1 Tax=Sphingomonas kyungheensis TaxID=1069987 RepID=A0ABU8H638_9SPHN|nr:MULTISPECIES: hypothetical protein [unclassified Sphingomonas]EZP53240.1 hypothetical protein BW41_02036 [Sphingomonas sp. RIT328]